MLMSTIASIDDGSICPLRNLPWNSCRLVANDKCMHAHVGNCLDGVTQAFAFVHTARRDNRFAAVSKLKRVRVESSKNKLTTVFPRKAGTLGMGRRLISAI
jgi:hypothetical protein